VDQINSNHKQQGPASMEDETLETKCPCDYLRCHTVCGPASHCKWHQYWAVYNSV